MFRLHFQTPLLAGFQGFYQHKDKEDLEGGGKMKPFVLPGLFKEGPLLGHHSSPCLGDEFPGEQKETSPCTNVQLNFAPPQDLGSLRPQTRIRVSRDYQLPQCLAEEDGIQGQKYHPTLQINPVHYVFSSTVS